MNLTDKKLKITTECHSCKFKKEVPGNSHIQCVKPDLNMRGNQFGIKKGWFVYPLLFDPVWKEKECSNFEVSAVSQPISQAVSHT